MFLYVLSIFIKQRYWKGFVYCLLHLQLCRDVFGCNFRMIHHHAKTTTNFKDNCGRMIQFKRTLELFLIILCILLWCLQWTDFQFILVQQKDWSPSFKTTYFGDIGFCTYLDLWYSQFYFCQRIGKLRNI